MSIDREKVWAQGQRFLQRGQTDKAIAEFERIVEDDPSDLRAPLKLGDLELQRGNVPAARAHFLRVADAYMQQGFWSKAIAVLRQISQAVQDDLEVQALLADLYDKQGLHVEASEQYLALTRLYLRHDQREEALAALERASEFDGTDAEAALAWAEQALSMGQGERARTKLTVMAERLKQESLLEAWAKVAERLLQLDPQHSGIACQLARHAMAAGQPAAALANLRIAFRAAPQDLDVLQLLAEAFEALGEVDKAVSVWAELAAQARRRGQQRMLERLLGHIVRLKPDDQEAQSELLRLSGASASAGLAVRRGVRKADHHGDERPLQAADAQALIVEAQVFYRYRLVGRAREYLARVLVAFPEHAEARALDQSYAEEAARRRAQRPPSARRGAPVVMHNEETAQSAVELWRQSQALEPAPAPSAPVPTLVLTPSALTAERLKLAEHKSGEKAAPEPVPAPAPAAVFDFDLAAEAPAPASPPPQKAEGPLDVDSLDALIAAAAPEATAPTPTPLTGDPSQISQALRAVATASPVGERYATTLQMGSAYSDMSLFDEALAQFEEVKAHPPLAAEAWRQAALCYVKKGDASAAVAALERGLAEPQASISQRQALHRELADTLRAMGRVAEADEHARQLHAPSSMA